MLTIYNWKNKNLPRFNILEEPWKFTLPSVPMIEKRSSHDRKKKYFIAF